MPPALDTPEEVAAMLAALFGLLGVIGAGLAGLAGVVITAWRSKVKPVLDDTRRSAGIAAHELRNNSGSSTRDAVDRIEHVARDLRGDLRSLGGDLREVRHELASERDDSSRAHSELFRRLRALESPPEPRETTK